jgi:hypothetical protein
MVIGIEFIRKQKFFVAYGIPALRKCGTECGAASVCSNGNPIKSTDY